MCLDKTFDQNEYIKNYRKENYRKIALDMKKEEFEMISDFFKSRNLSRNATVIQIALDYIKSTGFMDYDTNGSSDTDDTDSIDIIDV